MPKASVVGAGVFGAWIAHALLERGWTVTLVEQHGPGNSRSSSGGETRIIRTGYGDHALYAEWARDARARWLALEQMSGVPLFVQTGALFLGRNEGWLRKTLNVLQERRIGARWLTSTELATQYPQLQFDDSAGAVLEPEAGVLFARRAVQTLVRMLRDRGVTMIADRVDPQKAIRDNRDDALIFACGPWLPTLFPEALGGFIVPTRQEVFFFGVSSGGEALFDPGHLPAWVAFDEGVYGLPDLEHRGVKVAIDAHGACVDPETLERLVDSQALANVRHILRRRIPALADAPLIEARVCQYENTPDGHFVLDQLPGHDRIWIAGGGSGHGFKHGPSIGAYLADLLEGRRRPESMFLLSGRPARARAVY